MSFIGVSPGDLVMLLKALKRLAGILNGGAVRNFKRCAHTYRAFANVAMHLDTFAADHHIQNSDPFTHIRRDIEVLLGEYCNKIKEFQYFLGPHRVRRSFRGAIAKIRWSTHATALEELRQELNSRIPLVNTAILISGSANVRFLPGFSGLGPVPRPPAGDDFVFEDARREVHLISFRDIPNWEYFHEFLLRVFPYNSGGYRTVEMKSYVLHNASTGKDILPSSPCGKLFRDVTGLDERIEMSVILPYTDSDTTRCPKCNTRRRNTSCVVVTCHQCELWVRFMDSFEDKPDPLTQIAIEDIRESGLRAFSADFIAEIERSGYLNANLSERQLKELISRDIPGLSSHSPRETLQLRSEIRYFRRVTLCLPQWPSFGPDTSFSRSNRQLATVMDGLNNRLKLLRAGSDLRFLAAGMTINCGFAGRTGGFEDVLESALFQYNSRTQRNRHLVQLIPVLEAYSQCSEESRWQFHPTVVRVRCLLWTLSQVLALEGKLHLSCSMVLKYWSTLKEVKPGESPLLQTIVTIPFIANIVLWRLTFNIIDDVASLFSNVTSPPDFLGAIFRILKDSRSLCTEFCFEGNLDNCDLDLTTSRLFGRKAFASEPAFANWHASYRRCLVSILKSEGESLLTDNNYERLWTFTQSL